MSAILFDLDGVIYESNEPIAGASDTINWFKNNNIPHLFLTNTTSKSRSELVTKLATLGISTDKEKLLTPSVAARQWLLSHSVKNIALFVPETTSKEYSDFNLVTDNNSATSKNIIDAVVIGDLGESWTFETMNQILRTLINNPSAELIALGMTRYWKTDSGLQLDVGPMVKAFEYATGKNATVTGKPSQDFYKAAIDLIGDENLVMIGDDIHGDIEAAQHAGLKAVQVKTGKFSETDLESGITPDAILESVQQLPEWWLTNNM